MNSNRIFLENEQPGTEDWRITSPARNLNHEIEGFASETSVNLGDSIHFYVNTIAPQIQIDIFRMGWYQGLGAGLFLQLTR